MSTLAERIAAEMKAARASGNPEKLVDILAEGSTDPSVVESSRYLAAKLLGLDPEVLGAPKRRKPRAKAGRRKRRK